MILVARSGDTFKELGDEFGISWKKLVKYNDLQRDYTLTQGDIIYLKAKKKKASMLNPVTWNHIPNSHSTPRAKTPNAFRCFTIR